MDKSTIPTVGFYQALSSNLEREESFEELAKDLKVGFPICTASDFLEVVKKEASNHDDYAWNELLKMASDRASINGNSFWYLDELSRVADYYGRVAAKSGILNFIKRYIDSVTSGVEWKELIKLAKNIKDDHSYFQACKKLGILGGDLKSRKLRSVLAELVKVANGLVIGEELGTPLLQEDIFGLKNEAISKISQALGDLYLGQYDRDIFEERRALLEGGLERRLCDQLNSIPDSSGWISYYVNLYQREKIPLSDLPRRFAFLLDKDTLEKVREVFDSTLSLRKVSSVGESRQWKEGDRVRYTPSVWDVFMGPPDERLRSGSEGTVVKGVGFSWGVYNDPAHRYVNVLWDDLNEAIGVHRNSLDRVDTHREGASEFRISPEEEDIKYPHELPEVRELRAIFRQGRGTLPYLQEYIMRLVSEGKDTKVRNLLSAFSFLVYGDSPEVRPEYPQYASLYEELVDSLKNVFRYMRTSSKKRIYQYLHGVLAKAIKIPKPPSVKIKGPRKRKKGVDRLAELDLYCKYRGDIYRVIDNNEDDVILIKHVETGEERNVPISEVEIFTRSKATALLQKKRKEKEELLQGVGSPAPVSVPPSPPATPVSASAESSTVDDAIEYARGVLNEQANDLKVGDPCKILGDPSNPFYGKVGLVEKFYRDGMVGIRLRNTNDYLLRFIEDLAPVHKERYQIESDSNLLLTKDISDTVSGGRFGSIKKADDIADVSVDKEVIIQIPGRDEPFKGKITKFWSNPDTGQDQILVRNDRGEEIVALRSWVVVPLEEVKEVSEGEGKEATFHTARATLPLRERIPKELAILGSEKSKEIWERFVMDHPELEGKGDSFVKAVFARWIQKEPDLANLAILFPSGRRVDRQNNK